LLFEDEKTAFLIDGFFTRPSKLQMLFRKIQPDPELIADCLKHANIETLAGVIVAHSHYDHALDAPEVAKQTDAVLIGSESTASIGRAFEVDRIDVIKDGDTRCFGDFRLTFIEANHSPMTLFKRFGIDHVLFDGVVKDSFKTPARWYDYKEGGSYSVLIEHRGRKLLVQSSAGYLPEKLNAYEAEVVFLGIGTLGKQRDSYREAYWREVVAAVGARRVIPIHWDDFTFSLDQPLKPLSPIVDNFQKAVGFLLQRAEKSDVDVKFLPTWEARDPFVGLPDANVAAAIPSTPRRQRLRAATSRWAWR
jgi:L-ascorbate metabolism protein UlaG (beta-lactamase superfamily)